MIPENISFPINLWSSMNFAILWLKKCWPIKLTEIYRNFTINLILSICEMSCCKFHIFKLAVNVSRQNSSYPTYFKISSCMISKCLQIAKLIILQFLYRRIIHAVCTDRIYPITILNIHLYKIIIELLVCLSL